MPFLAVALPQVQAGKWERVLSAAASHGGRVPSCKYAFMLVKQVQAYAHAAQTPNSAEITSVGYRTAASGCRSRSLFSCCL